MIQYQQSYSHSKKDFLKLTLVSNTKQQNIIHDETVRHADSTEKSEHSNERESDKMQMRKTEKDFDKK